MFTLSFAKSFDRHLLCVLLNLCYGVFLNHLEVWHHTSCVAELSWKWLHCVFLNHWIVFTLCFAHLCNKVCTLYPIWCCVQSFYSVYIMFESVNWWKKFALDSVCFVQAEFEFLLLSDIWSLSKDTRYHVWPYSFLCLQSPNRPSGQS